MRHVIQNTNIDAELATSPTCGLCGDGSADEVWAWLVGVPTEAKAPGAKFPLELRDKLGGVTLETKPGVIVLGGEDVDGSPDPSGWVEELWEESLKRERSFLSKAWMSSIPGGFPCTSPSPSVPVGCVTGIEEGPTCTCWMVAWVWSKPLLSACWPTMFWRIWKGVGLDNRRGSGDSVGAGEGDVLPVLVCWVVVDGVGVISWVVTVIRFAVAVSTGLWYNDWEVGGMQLSGARPPGVAGTTEIWVEPVARLGCSCWTLLADVGSDAGNENGWIKSVWMFWNMFKQSFSFRCVNQTWCGVFKWCVCRRRSK